jgi:hypothetical protein
MWSSSAASRPRRAAVLTGDLDIGVTRTTHSTASEIVKALAG